MTEDDRREFQAYLAACTNDQVLGVLEKEQTAGRKDYVELAKDEARARGLAPR